jgi:protoporphyrinogen oxidase
MRVAVIGGGAAGLAAADQLLKDGHQVSLFEQGPQLGGQLRTVDLLGTRIECLYHHLFTTDTLMSDLVEELGLGDKLRWIPSKVGFFARDHVWDFVTPMDLLRFGALPLLDRVRLGLVGLYLQRQADWRRFEPYTAEEWLRRWAGPEAYRVVWGPLLYGKFGSVAPEVGMAWFHWKMRLRFGSRRGLSTEYLGYVLGSFAQVWEALGLRIQERGGQVHTSTAVRGIETLDGRVSGVRVADEVYPADRVIATVPTHVVQRIAPQLPASYVEALKGTRYQAVMCLLMVLKHPMSHVYWMNISDRSIPFVALIEQTNLIGPEHYQGKRVAYLSHYLATDDPLYLSPDEQVFKTYLLHLAKINPAFREDWIEEWHLFREDAAQPVITRNYSQKTPPLATPIPGLFMANNTQVYPEDRGQNYSIRIGREAARLAGL